MERVTVISQIRFSRVVMILLVLGGLALSTGPNAMTLTEVGDQLILSGPVVEGDSKKVRDALAGNANIRTVVLATHGAGMCRPVTRSAT